MAENKVLLGIDFQADAQSVQKLSNDLQKGMAAAHFSAVLEGTKAGFNSSQIQKAVGDLGKNFSETLKSETTKAITQINELEKKLKQKLESNLTDTQKANLKKQFEMQKANILDNFKLQQKLASDLVQDEMTERKKQYEELNKLLDDGAKIAGQSFVKQAGKLGQSLQGAFTNLRGGNVSGMIKNFADMMQQGAGRQRRKQQLLAKAGKGKAAAIAGKSAMMMGKAAMAMSGAAVGIGLIIALLAKAFSHMQKMNKEILEGATAFEVMSMAQGDFLGGLQDMRQAATDTALTIGYGIKAKDTIETFKAFGEGNLVLKELVGTASTASERQRKLKDVMIETTNVARALGIKSQELAKHMGEMMQEQGGNLDTIKLQFAGISKQAQNSGFQTKYFFQTVLEATSGMALYNARVAEAGNLLVQLGKILGAKMASDTVKELSKGFKSEGIADSYKRVLKAGQSQSQRVFKKEAQVASQQFLNVVGDQKGHFVDALSKVGVDLNLTGKTAEEQAKATAEAMAKLSGPQQERLIGELIANGDFDRKNVKQISNLVELAKAAGGNREAMAAAMDELGPGGVLQMQLGAVRGILGTTKKFHEMNSFAELKVLEDVGGFSREQIERLKEISLQAHAQFGKLQELKMQGDNASMDRIEQVRQFGAFVDENGKIISARLDKTGELIDENSQREVTSAEELVALQMAYSEKQLKPLMAETDYYSQLTAKATVTLGDIMEGAILAVLEEIAGYLIPIVSWIAGDLSEEEKQAKQEALTAVSEDASKVRKQDKALREQQNELDKTIKTTSDPKERAKAQRAMKELSMERRRLRIKQSGLAHEKTRIESFNYKDTSLFGLELFGEENEIARKDLSSVENVRSLAQGRGGVDTGMTTGEKLLLTAGVLTTGGTALGAYGTAGGLAYGLGGTSFVSGGSTLVGAIGGNPTGGPGFDARAVDSLVGEDKELFEAIKGFKSGVSDEDAFKAFMGQNDELLQEYFNSGKTLEDQKEEQKKTKEAVREVKDAVEESNAGSGLASTKIGRDLGYAGGTDTEDLIALGRAAKAGSSSDRANLRAALKTSGLDESQREIVRGAMKDGVGRIGSDGRVREVIGIDSNDAVDVIAHKQGGPIRGGVTGGGGKTIMNFYGGQTSEIIAHIDSLIAAGVINV